MPQVLPLPTLPAVTAPHATPGSAGFWSFKMKRKQGVREQAATFRSQWQAQMAGLKQKAAAKRWKQGRRRPAAAAGPATEGAPAAAAAASQAAAAGAAAGGPASSPVAREHVWRSMTKNARNADKAAAERAAAQQTLGATGRGAPQAVGAGLQPPPQKAHEAPQQRHAQPQQPQQPKQAAAAAQHTQQHSIVDEADSRSGHSSSSSSSSHAARLRQLMEHAATLVRGRQPGAGGHAASSAHAHAASDAHGHAHAAHAQPEEAASHAAPGRHWRGHMTLDQLASLLGGGSAGNAVPADQQLHRRFEAARRAQQEQHSAADASTAAAASEQPEAAAGEEVAQAEAEPQHSHQQHYEQHHYGGAHARKFANRGDVEERLSTQLAGLKRRAALKQEVQSSC